MLSLSAAGAEESPPLRALQEVPTRSALMSPLASDPRELDDAPDEPFETGWHGLRLRKGGVEVRRSLELGNRQMELGLRGPLLKRKRVGLKLELRF
jgi:hypothetical protein